MEHLPSTQYDVNLAVRSKALAGVKSPAKMPAQTSFCIMNEGLWFVFNACCCLMGFTRVQFITLELVM